MDLDTILFISLIMTFLGGPVILLIMLAAESAGDYKFEEHEIFNSFLTIAYVIMVMTFLVTFFMKQDQMKIEEQAKSTRIETIFKETGLSDLQSYFENDLGIDDITYNKETKKIIIDTNESSYAENIAKIDKRLAENANIKSVNFTRAGGKGGSIILIINLK